MRLLLAELSPEKGHLRLMQNLSQILSRDNEIITIYMSSINTEGITEYTAIKSGFSYYQRRYKNAYLDWTTNIIYTRKLAKYIQNISEKYKVDRIILVTYNEIGFYFAKNVFRDLSIIVLMNHNNIDFILNNRIKRMLFNTYSCKVKHIVQAKFIQSALSQIFQIPQDNIGIWLHPLNTNPVNEGMDIFDCVGISNSNDEEIINEIINFEKRTGIIKMRKLYIILRSKKYSYDDGFLRVINGYLSKADYNQFIDNARCVFLPFPNTFKYRMSGTLVDAFSNNKPIIATDIDLIQNAKSIYSSLIEIYSINTFIGSVEKFKKLNTAMKKQFNLFQTIHSEDNLRINMVTELNKVSENGKSYYEIDF